MMAILFASLLGLAIGSFLNCVVDRLEVGQTLWGRSYCPHCKHQLGWLELIPVVGFLVLRGQCYRCHAKISWQYPLVEILTALIFLLIFITKLTPPQFSIFYFLLSIFLFYIASSLIIIFFYDLKHSIIPDAVLLPAIVVALLLHIVRYVSRVPGGLLHYFLAACLASGFFLAVYLISRGRWIGFGDVKLAVLMGLVLGFPNILLALFMAFILGAAIAIILMAAKRKGLKSEIPFGPFLILGTFMAFLWGNEIINWYMNLFIL